MASIFSLDKQVANLPKHGFPMNQPFNFTSSCGHLLPIYFDILNPGEKIKYSIDLFTRTMPLSSPANVDIDEYVDVFFVPLKKISSAADNILFQISDLPSSALPAINTDIVLPLLDLSKLGVDISGGGSNTYLGTYGTGVTQYGIYATYFEDYISGMIRLFDHLQVDPNVLYDGNTAYQPMISPAAFAVYQSIYYDYYRPSNWQSNVIYAYNLDSAYNGLDLLATGQPWATPYALRELLQLRHRSWYKDYFTDVFPSPLVSNVGMMSSGINNLNSINQWLVNSNVKPILDDGTTNVSGAATTTSIVSPAAYTPSYEQRKLSTASLRTMFAVDKLLKITGRAGKHYDDQVLAHFGFKVPKGYSGEVSLIGSHHQQIHIGEVISTASTATGEIGELAGKGYGKGVGEVVKNFQAPCHGFVMAIYSCVPKVAYIGGLSKLHTMTKRYDWFIPELDNLGMQPLFSYEMNALATTPIGRAAWQLRYMQEKCKYPRATYAFKSSGNNLGVIYNDGPFADWVITDFYPFSGASFQTINLGRLMVSPCMLNEIMLVGYEQSPAPTMLYDSYNNPAPQNLYSTDPLIHFAKQTVSKVSGMSIYGLDDKAI